MAVFKIIIRVDTDWSETRIVSGAKWTVPLGGQFFVSVGEAPLVAFQMTPKLIGLGKTKPGDTMPITVTAFIDTDDPASGSVKLLSRKGAAGPVSYQSYTGSNLDVPVDYAVNNTNQDPLAIELALRPSTKAKREAEAEKQIGRLAPQSGPEAVRTILPSDEPSLEFSPEAESAPKPASPRGRKR